MKEIRYLTALTLLMMVVMTGFAQTTVMSFNIRLDTPRDGDNAWEYRKEEVVDLIMSYHPDFIGFQEAMPSQVAFFNENLEGYRYIGHGREGLNTPSEGIPLYYNSNDFELVDQKIFWLSETPDVVSRGWDAAYNRIAVYGVFRNSTTSELLHILNIHFDNVGDTARLKSAEMVLDFIEEQNLANEKFLLMGDFNSIPSDPPIELISQVLADSHELEDIPVEGPDGTFNGFDTETAVTRRIDYIFTKNLNPTSYRCIDDKRDNGLYPSDHFPLVIEF